MRPINADKLKEDVNEWLSHDYKTRVDLTAVKIPNKWLNALIKCIDNQPTVDVLDKIRAEIEQTADEEQKHDEKWAMGLRYADKIIGKYLEEYMG